VFLEAKAMIYECKTDYFSNGEQFCFMESIEYDQWYESLF